MASFYLQSSLSMQSQTSNLSQPPDQQLKLLVGVTTKTSSGPTVKGEYAATKYSTFSPLTGCFQILDFPLQTFEHFDNLFELLCIWTSSFGFYDLYV